VPLWTELIDISAQRRSLGYGYGGFWTPEHIVDMSNDQGWGVSASHSAYVDMLLALGPIGVFLYTTLLLLTIRRAQIRYHETYGDQTLAFLGTVQAFCLINGIADSASVEVSAFLCFCSILSLFYITFVALKGQEKVAKSQFVQTRMVARSTI
jgi:O-antigen ligase